MIWYLCHRQGTDNAIPVWRPAWPVSFLISLHHFVGFTDSTSPYYDSSGTLLFLQRIAPYFSRVGKLLSSSPAE